MHEADPKVRAAQLDEGKRFIDLAHRLNSPYVRVFGDQVPVGEMRQAVTARVIDGLRTLGEHAKGSGVAVIIESHGDFTDSPSLARNPQGCGDAERRAPLGRSSHVRRQQGRPGGDLQALGSYVRHTHLKDSRPEGSGVRYVLTGTGTVPVRETVAVLARGGYRGYYGFEWEKAWHPEIEEPEVAFPHYAELMRRLLAEAGVTPK